MPPKLTADDLPEDARFYRDRSEKTSEVFVWMFTDLEGRVFNLRKKNLTRCYCREETFNLSNRATRTECIDLLRTAGLLSEPPDVPPTPAVGTTVKDVGVQRSDDEQSLADYDDEIGEIDPATTTTLAAILRLRDIEGDAVTILCENPDGNGDNNCAIECVGGWTNYRTLRFEGEDLAKALLLAVIMKEGGQDIKHRVIYHEDAVPVVQRNDLGEGIHLAARWVQKRLDRYVREHGTEFPGTGAEYVEELDAIIDGIKALAASPVSNVSESQSGDKLTPDVPPAPSGYVHKSPPEFRPWVIDDWFLNSAGYPERAVTNATDYTNDHDRRRWILDPAPAPARGEVTTSAIDTTGEDYIVMGGKTWVSVARLRDLEAVVRDEVLVLRAWANDLRNRSMNTPTHWIDDSADRLTAALSPVEIERLQRLPAGNAGKGVE
jgi:hypothetical protein